MHAVPETSDVVVMNTKLSAGVDRVVETSAGGRHVASDGEERRVDREVPNREKYRIVGDWDCTLNQTNVGANNNKFYIIQLLVDDKDNHYCWTHWGRVGERGQYMLRDCASFADAQINFEQKFKEKTGNGWSDRANFVKKDGKYGIVELRIKPGDNAQSVSAPMGSLSRSQIEKGQAVLKTIEDVLAGAPDQLELNHLSSQFFTLIPTNFGRKKPEPIITTELVNEKKASLLFLLRMGFAQVAARHDDTNPLAGLMDLPVPETLIEAIGDKCPMDVVIDSLKKGEVASQKSLGHPIRPMTVNEYASIYLYTSTAIYKELNRALRKNDQEGIQKFAKYIRLLMHSLALLPAAPAMLYRGVARDLSADHPEGTTLTWWSFSSCSQDLSVAEEFAKVCDAETASTLMTIESKTACDINAISFYAEQRESLLVPGTQVRVTSCKKEGKIVKIHLEEIGRAA